MCANNIIPITVNVQPVSNYTFKWYDGPNGTGNLLPSTGPSWTPTINDEGDFSVVATEVISVVPTCNSSIGNFNLQFDRAGPISLTVPNTLTLDCNLPAANFDLAVATWLATATASDTNISSIPVSNNYAPFTHSCGARKTVEFWANDLCGNTTSATAEIHITDTTPPVITTPAANQTVECDGSGNTTALNNWLASHGGAVATDACGGTLTWTNNYSALSDLCGATGVATVTFTVSDACTNSSTTVATFTIVDTQAPTITCPPTATGNTNANECFSTTVVLGMATATDNCSTGAQVPITNNAPAQFPAGTTTVTWTATDACGNVATCTQRVTILDNNQPPTITCPGIYEEVIAADQCSKTGVTPGVPSIWDNCPNPALTYTLTGATTGSGIGTVSNTTFNVGVTTVTYTVTDVGGSTASCSFSVWIKRLDIPPATIACPSSPSPVNVTSGCSAMVTVDPPVITDICNTATFTMVNNYTGTATATADYPVGTTTVVWTITDNSLNVKTCTQTVTVIDDLDPVFTTCPTSVSEDIAANQCTKSNVGIIPPVVADNCSSTLTYTVVDAVSGTTSGTGVISSSYSFGVGTNTVTYVATDASGNSATCTFTVTIRRLDIPPATIACPSSPSPVNVTSGCSAMVTVDPPVITDVCNTATFTMVNDYTGTATATADYPVGTTTVVWTITDNSLNVKTCTQTVTVIDDLDPVFTTCPTSVSEDIAANQCTKSNVGITPPVVADNCSSTLTYTVVDAVSGTTSGTGVISSSYSFGVGTNTVTYVATDVSGNSATCTFTVTIRRLDIPPATIACPSSPSPVNVTSGCSAMVTVDPPVITDICNTATFTMVNDYTGTATATADYPVGTTTVVWTITDNSLNVKTCTQTVTVIDDIVPQFTFCPPSFSEPADFEKLFATNVDIPLQPTFVADNCTTTLSWTIVHETNGTVSSSVTTGINYVPTPYPQLDMGVNTVTYTLSDGSNTSTCTFTITITAKPVIDCPGDIVTNTTTTGCTQTLNPGVPELISGSQPISWTWLITDPDGLIQDSGAFSGTVALPGYGDKEFKLGTSTITWTATNLAGTASCTHTVTVEDKEPPTFTLPLPFSECVERIQDATYDAPTIDITPARPEYYIFVPLNNYALDLPLLLDNCCATASITVNWRIEFTDPANPSGTPASTFKRYWSTIQVHYTDFISG